MHLAQVLQTALREQQGQTTTAFPEKRYVYEMKLNNPYEIRNNMLLLDAVGMGVAIYWALKKEAVLYKVSKQIKVIQKQY